ncbi:hypothetical protein GCM10010256_60890 [Streptomyces coeruleorubidus]|nr:hypothetical protein GCM10010256_60890 [Streptomyces coeruleorubidus]
MSGVGELLVDRCRALARAEFFEDQGAVGGAVGDAGQVQDRGRVGELERGALVGQRHTGAYGCGDATPQRRVGSGSRTPSGEVPHTRRAKERGTTRTAVEAVPEVGVKPTHVAVTAAYLPTRAR